MFKCVSQQTRKVRYKMSDKLTQSESQNSHANVLYGLKQYSNAIQFYTQAIKLCPQIAKYYGNRAQCYIMLNDHLKALIDAKKCVELDKGNLKGYKKIVRCCLATGDFYFAESTLVTAIGIFKEDRDLHYQLEQIKKIQQYQNEAFQKLEKKRYEEALKCIEKCIELAPNCLNLRIKKAECLIYIGNYAEAEQLANDVLKTKSGNDDALYVQACSQFYNGDIDKTFKLLQELKRKQPDHPNTNKLFRSASIIRKKQADIEKALRENEPEKAYKLINEAIKIDENNKCTNKRLYKQKIDIASKTNSLHWDGTKDCTECMKIYGTDLSILKKRAQLYMQLQDYDDAVLDYEKIAKEENNKENNNLLEKAKKLLAEQLKDDRKILRVSKTANADEIKAAYQKLLKRYHGDKNHNESPERRALLDQKVIKIRKAAKNLGLKI